MNIDFDFDDLNVKVYCPKCGKIRKIDSIEIKKEGVIINSDCWDCYNDIKGEGYTGNFQYIIAVGIKIDKFEKKGE